LPLPLCYKSPQVLSAKIATAKIADFLKEKNKDKKPLPDNHLLI